MAEKPKDSIRAYLKKHLRITLEARNEYGSREGVLEVKLLLDDEVISTDDVPLPISASPFL
jgi:hypothetical protein